MQNNEYLMDLCQSDIEQRLNELGVLHDGCLLCIAYLLTLNAS